MRTYLWRASVWRPRFVLYMCTLVAIKRNPPISAYYRRLCAAGKPSKVALIACIRKLAVMLKERNIVVADARSGLIWRRLLSPESGGPAQIPEHVKRSAAQA
jgi:hypothetical protein